MYIMAKFLAEMSVFVIILLHCHLYYAKSTKIINSFYCCYYVF